MNVTGWSNAAMVRRYAHVTARLRRDLIAHLGTLDFITARDNVIFLGPPGTGKTHLAIGLAIRACQAGHRVLFATAAEWVARLADAHHAGRLQSELIRLGRYPLLVIDEVGYIPFEPEAANLFFQLVSARYERASLIVTSNKPFGKAHMFTAICARRRLKRDMFGNVGVEDRRWCGVVSADGDRGTSGAVSVGVARRPSGPGLPALALFLLPFWEALACPVLSFP